MARSQEIQGRITAFARQLGEELGEVDDSDALSWLDAIETQAVEIGDAVHAELVKQQSISRPVADESVCPAPARPKKNPKTITIRWTMKITSTICLTVSSRSTYPTTTECLTVCTFDRTYC